MKFIHSTKISIKQISMVISITLLLLTNLAYANQINSEDGEVERIYGMFIDPKGIVFQVSSNGCTVKKDFKVSIRESYPLQLELRRTRPDYCKGYIPYGRKILFTFKELGLNGGDQFVVSNSVEPFTIPHFLSVGQSVVHERKLE